MSEHEGFCVPLVEAMYFNTPIVAYDSCAIKYTLGGSGILLDNKNPMETAGVINYLINDELLNNTIVKNQRERLADFDNKKIEKLFMSYLEEFIQGV